MVCIRITSAEKRESLLLNKKCFLVGRTEDIWKVHLAAVWLRNLNGKCSAWTKRNCWWPIDILPREKKHREANIRSLPRCCALYTHGDVTARFILQAKLFLLDQQSWRWAAGRMPARRTCNPRRHNNAVNCLPRGKPLKEVSENLLKSVHLNSVTQSLRVN